MKPLKPSVLAAVWICSSSFSFSDTIVMKNGDTYEGRVLREENGNYVLEVKVTDTIRDEKTVVKSDVKYIDKEKPDLKAFDKIAELVPTPELLGTEEYEARIEKLNGFIAAYPKSGKVSKAKEMINVLEEELEVVREGGIKYGEEMVIADDYNANAYEYDSVIAAKKIKEAVSRRDLLGALRRFSKYDAVYIDSEGREDLVPLIQQVLTAYGTSVQDSLASIESRLEKRTAGLAQMSTEDRAQTERALEERHERLTARFLSETDAKEAWVTPDAFHKESLELAAKQVESEIKRLETGSKNLKPLEVPVAETYRVSWGKLAGGSDEEKKEVLTAAKTNRVPEKYLAKLNERAGIEVK